MSADSEKPNIIGGNWTKYCTVAKSVGRGRPIWTSVVVRARVNRALQPVQSNTGRHILESRCAERCANDVFSTSFRVTLRHSFLDKLSGNVTWMDSEKAGAFLLGGAVCAPPPPWKLLEKYEKYTTFVRMRRCDHLGEAKMSKKGTSLRWI